MSLPKFGFVAALIGLLTIVPAAAAQDFQARIRMAGFDNPVEYRRSGSKARADIVVGNVTQTYIADPEKGVLIHLISTGGKRVALLFPLDRHQPLLPLPLELSVLEERSVARPIGSSLIGGQSCRLFEFSAYLNQSGVACVNGDDIIMQMTQKGRNAPLFQVVSYAPGPQDAKWFSIPPDYQTAALPGLGGASAQAIAPSFAVPVTPAPSASPPVTPPFRKKQQK